VNANDKVGTVKIFRLISKLRTAVSAPHAFLLVLTILAMAITATLAQTPQPSKEYIRLGGRVIAVKVPSSTATATATPVVTQTATPTPTPVVTQTATATPTKTATATPTATKTATATATATMTPGPVSLSPSSGSGSSATFTLTVTDPKGAADVTTAALYIQNSAPATGSSAPNQNSCGMMYSGGFLDLYNDQANGILSGSSATNSQCTLVTTGSTYSTSGMC